MLNAYQPNANNAIRLCPISHPLAKPSMPIDCERYAIKPRTTTDKTAQNPEVYSMFPFIRRAIKQTLLIENGTTESSRIRRKDVSVYSLPNSSSKYAPKTHSRATVGSETAR